MFRGLRCLARSTSVAQAFKHREDPGTQRQQAGHTVFLGAGYRAIEVCELAELRSKAFEFTEIHAAGGIGQLGGAEMQCLTRARERGLEEFSTHLAFIHPPYRTIRPPCNGSA